MHDEVPYVNQLAMGDCDIEVFEEIATKKYIPQMCTLPPKKNKHQMFKPICLPPPLEKKDKSKMNTYPSMFFSPYKKSPKSCEVLGP